MEEDVREWRNPKLSEWKRELEIFKKKKIIYKSPQTESQIQKVIRERLEIQKNVLTKQWHGKEGDVVVGIEWSAGGEKMGMLVVKKKKKRSSPPTVPSAIPSTAPNPP